MSGQSPVDPPEPCGWVRATASSTLPEGLVQCDPLDEPDHFIDVFAPNWTARIDYQYLGLQSTAVTPGFLVDTFTINNANVQPLTVGVNYLFNWGAAAPVVSRY